MFIVVSFREKPFYSVEMWCLYDCFFCFFLQKRIPNSSFFNGQKLNNIGQRFLKNTITFYYLVILLLKK